MSKKDDRKNIILNVRISIFNLMIKVLKENDMPKSTFAQQALIEKMMYLESFRREILKTLEQNKDIDYYNAISAFKELDAIQNEYQNAAEKIVKIVYQRIK